MKSVVYIACSLDGFIARMDGNLDWLLNIPNPNNSDFGFNEFMKSIDAIVMGRNTFEVVSGFSEWPYNKPVIVLSNTLNELDQKFLGKAQLMRGDLTIIIEELNKKNINNLYIDGGKTIQSFLRNDLIDEMIITTISILLGNGIKLFNDINNDLQFDILDSKILSNEMIKIHYKRRNRTIAST